MSMAEAVSVQPIDKTSVHKICSGQVILTLATAVKELVENSLDAGASSIEVKLKAFGEESIEVSDNGIGIEPHNFESLALKHHTSKLRDFSDLIGVQTFGFRGEALSSLSALCDLTVATRNQSNEIGSKLDFDHNGTLSLNTPCARQLGTTVTLKKLFKPLPVRHKEFVKNIKKEFNKMCQILHAYCLIRPDVKFNCSNISQNNKRAVVVTAMGKQDVIGSINNIFGHQQGKSLKMFHQQAPKEDILNDYGVTGNVTSSIFCITGYVSTCEHGQGRSTTDRQFYFINKRPCDNSKISRLVNEVYHQFNRHQYPFVFLNIEFIKESIDVNVTPDKRLIFVQDEKVLLATIKTSLMEMYSTSTGDMCTSLQSQIKISNESMNSKSLSNQTLAQCSLNKLKRAFSLRSNTESLHTPAKQTKLDIFTVKDLGTNSHHTFATKGAGNSNFIDSPKEDESLSENPTSAKNISELSDEISFYSKESSISSSEMKDDDSESINKNCDIKISDSEYINRPEVIAEVPHSTIDISHKLFSKDDQTSMNLEFCTSKAKDNFNQLQKDSSNHMEVGIEPIENSETLCASNDKSISEVTIHEKSIGNRLSDDDTSLDAKPSSVITFFDETEEVNKKVVTIPLNFNQVEKMFKKHEDRKQDDESKVKASFHAKITPEDSKKAEDELRKAISKDMFAKMEILFQFNLGFIIAKLDSDLFIIDQHASDEKYNFEMLQRNATLQTQKLIHPQPLNLTAVNETILKDSIEIFRKNGFEIEFDDEDKPLLVSIPIKKNWTFGKDDIDELIFMLSDSPGVMCRPSRVQQMFASQSCRKSIMVGTGLSLSNMKKLICHMGEIEQPWNCPHGRPTIRHLVNLNRLYS